MYHSTKHKIHVLLHPELGDTRWDKILNAFIIVLIVLNVAAVILETVQPIHDKYAVFFHYFDMVSVFIFTIEYLLRVWSCNHDPRYQHKFHGRLHYIFSTEALIDLIAILPFYIHVVVGLDLRVLRILRLLRFFRLFRLTAYMKSAKMVRSVFTLRANELKLSFVLITFVIIIASCLMYFAEHNTQPDKFSSIPATMWWAVVTVTSIGYGDMVPISTLGKTLSGIISFMGLAIFALPAGIITAGFLEEIGKAKRKKHINCPHCHQPINVDDLHQDHHEHH
ncbi:MAG TPA: ion transporter [Ferruginibacter sp.]|nr:ion transporter [Ferruginibacter sp.]HPH91676.1 ion transporter [Ferruginibacter sp.]